MSFVRQSQSTGTGADKRDEKEKSGNNRYNYKMKDNAAFHSTWDEFSEIGFTITMDKNTFAPTPSPNPTEDRVLFENSLPDPDCSQPPKLLLLTLTYLLLLKFKYIKVEVIVIVDVIFFDVDVIAAC